MKLSPFISAASVLTLSTTVSFSNAFLSLTKPTQWLTFHDKKTTITPKELEIAASYVEHAPIQSVDNYNDGMYTSSRRFDGVRRNGGYGGYSSSYAGEPYQWNDGNSGTFSDFESPGTKYTPSSTSNIASFSNRGSRRAVGNGYPYNEDFYNAGRRTNNQVQRNNYYYNNNNNYNYNNGYNYNQGGRSVHSRVNSQNYVDPYDTPSSYTGGRRNTRSTRGGSYYYPSTQNYVNPYDTPSSSSSSYYRNQGRRTPIKARRSNNDYYYNYNNGYDNGYNSQGTSLHSQVNSQNYVDPYNTPSSYSYNNNNRRMAMYANNDRSITQSNSFDNPHTHFSASDSTKTRQSWNPFRRGGQRNTSYNNDPYYNNNHNRINSRNNRSYYNNQVGRSRNPSGSWTQNYVDPYDTPSNYGVSSNQRYYNNNYNNNNRNYYTSGSTSGYYNNNNYNYRQPMSTPTASYGTGTRSYNSFESPQTYFSPGSTRSHTRGQIRRSSGYSYSDSAYELNGGGGTMRKSPLSNSLGAGNPFDNPLSAF